MLRSGRNGKITSDVRDFLGERHVDFFASHGVSKTANTCIHFLPRFSVVEGIPRIILPSSAFGDECAYFGNALLRVQTFIFVECVHLIHGLCAAAKVQDRCEPAT